MTDLSFWNNVDSFTVEQAAALWVGLDPQSISPFNEYKRSEFLAAKQMLESAIHAQVIEFDPTPNPLRIIGDHSNTLVNRSDLEKFARSKNLSPPFLFDTLAPTQRLDTASHTVPNEPSSSANRGGRPPEYDWDAFTMEVIFRANSIDGLPDRQSGLISKMLQWFRDTYDKEPSESNVRMRISKIYNYLEDRKNATS